MNENERANRKRVNVNARLKSTPGVFNRKVNPAKVVHVSYLWAYREPNKYTCILTEKYE